MNILSPHGETKWIMSVPIDATDYLVVHTQLSTNMNLCQCKV